MNGASIFEQARQAITRDLIERVCGAGEWRADDDFWCRSPIRADSEVGSFHISSAGLWHDFATDEGGDLVDILVARDHCTKVEAAKTLVQLAGQEPVDDRPTKKTPKKDRPKPLLPIPTEAFSSLNSLVRSKWAAEHYGEGVLGSKYTDAAGRVLFVVVRYERDGKKTIRPYYFGEDREWREGQALGRDRPILPLPEVLASPDLPVLVVEGEKKRSVEVAGFIVATWAGGSSAVDRTDWSPLANRDVTVWPDNDPPGVKAAQVIKNRLPHARVLRIENRPRGWDLADSVADFPTPETRAAFIEQCPTLEQVPTEATREVANDATDDDVRPQIVANNRDLRELAEEAIGALFRANEPPRIFRRGSEYVRIADAMIRPLTESVTRHELARSAAFLNRTPKGALLSCPPPIELVRDIPAWPSLPFPRLDMVIHGPTFSATGELLTTLGYHPEASIFIDNQIEVAEFNGSGADAAQWLLAEMFVDFPFATQADRANALGALVTCLVRRMIAGNVPGFGSESSIHGAGKGLLVDSITFSAFGPDGAEIAGYSEVEEEIRKHITASLSRGRAAIKWDNVRDRIDSPSMALLLTTEQWSDRILGRSEIVTLAVYQVNFFTGNNPSLSGEMARRYIRMRLVPDTEQPWTRANFRHPDLLEWVIGHRGEVIGAIARMVGDWIKAGRPNWSGRPLGSFERWSRIVGGILEASSVAGFMENHAEVFEAAEFDSAAWHTLVEMWAEAFEDSETSSGELFEIAQKIDDFPLPGKTERGQRTAFGVRLSKQRDRVYGDRRIVWVDSQKNGARYRLLKGNLGNLGNLYGESHAREDFKKDIDNISYKDRAANLPQVPQGSPRSEGITV